MINDGIRNSAEGKIQFEMVKCIAIITILCFKVI